MKRVDQLFTLCFLVCTTILITKFCHKQTDTFTILGISSSRPYNGEFDTRALTKEESQELEIALNQPYTYFGRGGQAYAFFSADGKYVIKFFKQRLFRPPYLLNYLPLPKILHRYREKRNWKRFDKLQRDFFSYKAAFEKLQNQTGIIYTHLNPTSHLKTHFLITDRLGIQHRLNLDTFDFVVQKRAERVYDRISALMKTGNRSGAEEALKSVFELISTRAKMGYRDRDPNIRTNCGFLDDKAIKIDVGRFVISEYMQTTEGHNAELLRITAPFEEWIETSYPELLPAFKQALSEVLL